jgi:hypothetical protein
MTIQKIAAIAGIIALAGGWWTGAWAQVRPVQHGYGSAGASSQPGHRPPPTRPEGYRSLPPVHSNYRPGPYRPPIAAVPPLRYRQPTVIITAPIVVGSVLPYGYGGYPIDNWSYYNLSAPCCG